MDTANQHRLKLVKSMGLFVHQKPRASMFIWADAGRDTQVLDRQRPRKGSDWRRRCCFMPIRRVQ